MKTRIIILFLFLLNANLVVSQEWKNLKAYQKETGQTNLQEGCWLKKDRKQQNEAWQKANLFNLSTENGHLKYARIEQIRDFYLWFDLEIKKQGHEIKWFGIAGIVADQLSKTEVGIIRVLIIRNKEVVAFSSEGSKKVFEYAFPKLKTLYYSDKKITGADAERWDYEYGTTEQCVILNPLYDKLSPKAFRKLDCMAKRKGIFAIGIPKKMEYIGSIEDCHARFEHGIKTIYQSSLETK